MSARRSSTRAPKGEAWIWTGPDWTVRGTRYSKGMEFVENSEIEHFAKRGFIARGVVAQEEIPEPQEEINENGDLGIQ